MKPLLPRPVRVAFTSYLLFFNAAIGVIGVFFLKFFPKYGRPPVHLPLASVELTHSLIVALCGIYIYQGKNWARWLFYLAVIPAAAAMCWFRHIREDMAFCVITALAGGFMLATPRARRYFKGQDPYRNTALSARPAPPPQQTRGKEGKYDY
jgi:hypothetical protein